MAEPCHGGHHQGVTFDPWAPPPEAVPPQYPPWETWETWQPGYPPPLARQRRPSVAGWVVAGVAIAIAGVLGLWAFSSLVAPYRPEALERSRRVTVPADGKGPAFAMGLPGGWETTDVATGETTRIAIAGGDALITVITLPGTVVLTPELDLDRVLRDVLHSPRRIGPPLSRPVGGEPALVQRVASRAEDRDNRVAVFRGAGHRWLVTYYGPDRGTREEPYELGLVLEGWQW